MALVVCSLVGFLVNSIDCSLIIVFCLNFGDLLHRSPCAFISVCAGGGSLLQIFELLPFEF